jgi:hypothetical protein
LELGFGISALERLTSVSAVRPVDFLDVVHILPLASLKQGELRLAAEVLFRHSYLAEQIWKW